jgi:hypothetical protein
MPNNKNDQNNQKRSNNSYKNAQSDPQRNFGELYFKIFLKKAILISNIDHYNVFFTKKIY